MPPPIRSTTQRVRTGCILARQRFFSFFPKTSDGGGGLESCYGGERATSHSTSYPPSWGRSSARVQNLKNQLCQRPNDNAKSQSATLRDQDDPQKEQNNGWKIYLPRGAIKKPSKAACLLGEFVAESWRPARTEPWMQAQVGRFGDEGRGHDPPKTSG